MLDSIQSLENLVVVIFVWVTFNYKKAVRFKIILSKLNCNYCAFGLSDFRTIGQFDYQTFGLLGFWTIGSSAYWADTVITSIVASLIVGAVILVVMYVNIYKTIISHNMFEVTLTNKIFSIQVNLLILTILLVEIKGKCPNYQ